jgi:hypothetical protein
MLNQETGQTNVPGRVARACGHRTKRECRSCKAVDVRMPFYGLRWRSLASLQTPGLLLCYLAGKSDVQWTFLKLTERPDSQLAKNR